MDDENKDEYENDDDAYSANGDVEPEDYEFDAYAATEEGVCWCGNDGCEHIESNLQKQCCACAGVGADAMCGECQSLLDSYFAASAVTPRSYIRAEAVVTHRGLDIVKVGNVYRVFFPVVGSPGLTQRTFPSVRLAKKWINEDSEMYATGSRRPANFSPKCKAPDSAPTSSTRCACCVWKRW